MHSLNEWSKITIAIEILILVWLNFVFQFLFKIYLEKFRFIWSFPWYDIQISSSR